MPLNPGARLGPYEIIALIGAGGMGEVYRARDVRLDRLVAIKLSKEQFSERFDREARAVAALSHPNVCHLYDVGPNYLVMEHVEGVPVSPPGNPRAVLDAGIQIAEGLVAAHQAGIVHRDLKPGNILLTRDGRVKILDFGLATLTPGVSEIAAVPTMVATDPGTTVGTVAYMSPEQASGQPVDARSDLWSVGVVLYELATGVRPFEGATQALIFDAILNKAPIPVRERNPAAPLELARAIERLLEKDRALRYQSAADLRADLKRVERDSSSQRSVAATTPPVTARRTRRLAVIATAAVVLVGLALGIFVWQGRSASTLSARDVVVLADVTNTTGDAVFDNTLRTALSIQLEQSPFLKIMGDDQMREGLRLMQRPPDERITTQVAREICQRLGEKATLSGAIARLGDAYVLTLEAANCQNGEAIAREQVQAENKERVLEAVSQASKAMRSSLGESLASIEKLDRPLDQVTTSSLEALQAYAQGTEHFNRGDALAARPLFERATTLDPNFAMAWWFLSSSYQNAGLGQRSEYIEKAFSLRDRLSDRERLSIEAAYYGQRTGEWDKASDAAQTWAQTYPRVALPHFMLVGFRLFEGRSDEALRESLEAARLEPTNELIVAGLIGTYGRLDRFEDAKAVAEKAIADKIDAPGIRLNLLRIAFIENDRAAIDRHTQWFAGRPDEYIAIAAHSVNALTLGQRRQASQLQQKAAGMAKRRGLPAPGALNPVDDTLLGNCPPEDSPAANNNALVIALCSDAATAGKLADEAAKRPVMASNWLRVQLPLIRAIAELKRSNPDAAVELLRPVVPHDLFQPPVPYIRGLAYLAARKGSEAAAEFQKLVDHRGIHWQFQPVFPRETGPLRAMAYVGVARGAALAGDTARAKQAYQDFLALWKDADPELPILIEAQKEYAALN